MFSLVPKGDSIVNALLLRLSLLFYREDRRGASRLGFLVSPAVPAVFLIFIRKRFLNILAKDFVSAHKKLPRGKA